MSVRVDPSFMKDLKAFGLKDANKCMHCGNCTAVCPLSTPENPFPRKLVKYAQMGLKDKILKSSEPWLCYYCGDCSDTCPRGADPGEAMMAMRRYLTSQYDWTGFARRFYTSERFEIIAVAIVGIFIGLGLWIFHGSNPNMEHAHLNSVWPAPSIEIADFIMGAILSILLLSNTWRCVKFTMGDLLKKIPLEIYITQAKELIIHFLTQKKFGECTDSGGFYRRGYTHHRAFLGGHHVPAGCDLSILSSHAYFGVLCYFCNPLWDNLCHYRTSQAKQDALQEFPRDRLDVSDPFAAYNTYRNSYPFLKDLGFAINYLYHLCGSSDGGCPHAGS
jgi:ferredoxin